MYTQEEMKTAMIPLLRANGQVYCKYKAIKARKAKEGERIKTITSDGLETINTAKQGDYIIQNQTSAKENYIIGESKFNSRYLPLQPAEDDFHWYQPTGKVLAIEFTPTLIEQLKVDKEFHFVASWGTEMVLKEHDFLVCPLDGSSVYRIGRQEFFETYQAELDEEL
ncbi:MAG: hypothetical protein AAFP19_20505 [Bacteroidota bacterium]